MVIVMNEKMMKSYKTVCNVENNDDTPDIIFMLGGIYERINKNIYFIVKNN